MPSREDWRSWQQHLGLHQRDSLLPGDCAYGLECPLLTQKPPTHPCLRIEVEIQPGVSDPLHYIAMLLDFSIPPPFRTPELLRKGVALYDPDSGDRCGTVSLVDIPGGAG